MYASAYTIIWICAFDKISNGTDGNPEWSKAYLINMDHIAEVRDTFILHDGTRIPLRIREKKSEILSGINDRRESFPSVFFRYYCFKEYLYMIICSFFLSASLSVYDENNHGAYHKKKWNRTYEYPFNDMHTCTKDCCFQIGIIPPHIWTVIHVKPDQSTNH